MLGYRLAALALLTLSACGGGGSSGTPVAPSPTPAPPPIQAEPEGIDKVALRQQVAAFVVEQQRRIEALHCHQSQTGPCERIPSIRFSEGQAEPAKLRADQTILLIDQGMAHAATLRYRSRMLGYYRVNESTGLLEPHDAVVTHTPRWGAELLRAIDSFQYREAASGQTRPSFVPAEWLKALRPLLTGARDFVPPAERATHGRMVLSQLVESSPQAGFVLLDPPPIGSLLAARRAQFCARDAAGLQHGAQRLTESLQAVMTQHGVDYVNLSDGLDWGFMQAHWARLGCEGTLTPEDGQRLMLALRPLFAQLFGSPSVLGVQAAGGQMSALTHPLDLLELPHRVRVSYFHPRQAPPLPPDGVTGSQRPAVDEPSASDRRWIDVFIGSGIVTPGLPPQLHAAPPLQTNAVYGLGLWPLDHATTSWSAPHALNRLIHLKQQLAPTLAPEAPLDPALIQRMKDALTPTGCSWAPEDGGRCKLQDPAWHRQQALFRQGWLPIDWRWE